MNIPEEEIDGVRGRWLTVTKQDQVHIGQRVRYTCIGGERFGYERDLYERDRFMSEGGRSTGYTLLFENREKREDISIIQAFYPIGKKEKKSSKTPKKTKKAKNPLELEMPETTRCRQAFIEFEKPASPLPEDIIFADSVCNWQEETDKWNRACAFHAGWKMKGYSK